METEAWSGDEGEPAEADDTPAIEEEPAEIPPSWNAPAPNLESPPAQESLEEEKKIAPEPAKPEPFYETDSTGRPLAKEFESLLGADAAHPSPPGATDDSSTTTKASGAATDDSSATDQPANTGGAQDNQSAVAQSETEDTSAKEAPPVQEKEAVKSLKNDPETDEFLKQVNELRRQQEEELKQDLEAFKNRPVPPYWKPSAGSAPDTASKSEMAQGQAEDTPGPSEAAGEVEPLDPNLATDVLTAVKEAEKQTPSAGSKDEAGEADAKPEAKPDDKPGGKNWEPSPTGVVYPDPEKMEGNVGGVEKLG